MSGGKDLVDTGALGHEQISRTIDRDTVGLAERGGAANVVGRGRSSRNFEDPAVIIGNEDIAARIHGDLLGREVARAEAGKRGGQCARVKDKLLTRTGAEERRRRQHAVGSILQFHGTKAEAGGFRGEVHSHRA